MAGLSFSTSRVSASRTAVAMASGATSASRMTHAATSEWTSCGVQIASSKAFVSRTKLHDTTAQHGCFAAAMAPSMLVASVGACDIESSREIDPARCGDAAVAPFWAFSAGSSLRLLPPPTASSPPIFTSGLLLDDPRLDAKAARRYQYLAAVAGAQCSSMRAMAPDAARSKALAATSLRALATGASSTGLPSVCSVAGAALRQRTMRRCSATESTTASAPALLPISAACSMPSVALPEPASIPPPRSWASSIDATVRPATRRYSWTSSSAEWSVAHASATSKARVTKARRAWPTAGTIDVNGRRWPEPTGTDAAAAAVVSPRRDEPGAGPMWWSPPATPRYRSPTSTYVRARCS
mmetsp:Transcript_36169/g.111452  ORF Transcript_36169/g.111452 Transcript_36169/m.111452 type:complete len:355 (+) Transcript_36169:369-1433(+)